jgi:hypothetical protein
MWMPNIIMGAFGLYMLLRVAKEKPIGLEFISNYYKSFHQSLVDRNQPSHKTDGEAS